MRNQSTILLRIFSSFFLFAIVSGCSDPQSSPEPVTDTAQSNKQTEQSLQKAPLVEETNSVPEGALPDLAYPLYYTLDLTIDPQQDTFTGHAKLDIELKQPSDGFWIHGQNLSVTSVISATEDGQVYPAEYTQRSESGVAWVDFGQQFPKGKLSLIFDYQAKFDRNLSGLFKVEEQGDAYVLAKSESIQARKFLPSFDQPGFKSPYLISMTIPKGMTAISNTREKSIETVDEQLIKFQFAETRSMPTYLLSVAVGPFDILELDSIPTNAIRDFEIPLRAVARRGRAKDMSFVMGITAKYMELFETALAQPYPFKKLDIVAAPQWPSGATELSAAITYREQRVLLGDNPAPGAKLSIMNTHAHEIAHMWFGNLVTPPWWDDLWLKEGFSTWATPVILEQFEPGAGHDLNAIRSNFNTMRSDSLASTRAIRQPILKNANIRNAYDAITYRKSQAVIHMIDSYFGPEKFRKALGSYVAEYADGVADSPQFYQSIGKHTGEKALTETFKQFVEQKGVPFFDIKLKCEQETDASLEFKQSRYKPLGTSINSNHQWTVPLCVSYKINGQVEKSCDLISPSNSAMNLKTQQCPSWVMPNAEGAGYYRWKMSDSNLASLIEHFDELNNAEKIAVLDSIFAGFEAGEVGIELMTAGLKLSSQSQLRQLVELPLEKVSDYIKKVLSKQQASRLIATISPWYLTKISELESNRSELTDSQLLTLNNLTKFAAGSLKDLSIRKELKLLVDDFIDKSKSNLPSKLSSDLYSSAFTIAIEDGGASYFEKLVEARKHLDNPLFDNASAYALGAIQDVTLVEKVQQYALSENVGSRESFAMLAAMLSNTELGDKHWQWFKNNVVQIFEKIPAQWRRRSPRLAGGSCSQKRLNDLDALFEQYGEQAPGYELALAQTKESVLLCDALKMHLAK
jgi:aminopeptidase N